MIKLLKPTLLACFFLFGNIISNSLLAQTNEVCNSDFKKLEHQWKGNLQYLNYQDDKMKVTLLCTMKTKFKKEKLWTHITFDEIKDGKKMTSKSSFRISKNKKYLLVDKEKWTITSNEKTKDQIKITATKRGKDNNRPSDLRMTLIIENGKSMTWQKDVKYDGTASFFNRNQFSFTL